MKRLLGLPFALGAMLGLFLLLGGLSSTSAKERTVYNFNSPNGSFFNPNNTFDPFRTAAGLVLGNDGNFYGTTPEGGSGGDGTVFQVTPAGKITTLVAFNGANGFSPHASLVLGRDGSFYGTTQGLAVNENGTVFKVTTDGTAAGTTLTTLAKFNGANGSSPTAALIQGSDGNFYGTTPYGGSHDSGTVFKLATDGTAAGTTLTTLVSFDGSANGSTPLAALIQGRDGSFYGTTSSRGYNNNGTVFKLTTDGTAAGSVLTTLFLFNETNGRDPQAALVQASDGSFYGTTPAGGTSNSSGGTVFRLTTDGTAAGTTLTTLVNFTDGFEDGPTAALLSSGDGSFYGTTEGGGRGTLFKLTTDGTAAGSIVTTLVNFNGANGSGPNTALIRGRDGSLYGSTLYGGSSGEGSLFKLTTDGTAAGSVVTTLVTLGYDNGTAPTGLVLGRDGNFYGTTGRGGSSIGGTVFQLTPTGALTTLISFNGANGQAPVAPLVLGRDGSFYGITQDGGSDGYGTVYKLTTDGTAAGTTLTTLTSFHRTNGAYPTTLLPGSDGSFYGTTMAGGGHSHGTVFKLTTSGTAAGTRVTTLYSFAVPDSSASIFPTLIEARDGSFFGTTLVHGRGASGSIFRLTTDGTGAGTVVTTLFSFSGFTGPGASAPLIQAGDGSFYGTTGNGGSHKNGSIFKLTTDGTAAATTLTTLFSFSGSNGSSPAAALLQDRNGCFYGTTSSGGSNFSGTAFQLTTDGTAAGSDLTTLVNFGEADQYRSSNGYAPLTALVQAEDGSFYGTTSQGGNGYYTGGTVFQIDLNNLGGRPVASNGAQSTLKNTPVGVALTFFDPNGNESAQGYAIGIPEHGTLSHQSVSFDPLSGQGVIAATYTPEAGFLGADSFPFAVTNNDGTGNTATESLTVTSGTAGLQGLKFNPMILMGGGSTEGEVALTSPAASATTVTLTSSNPAVLPVRSSVTITPGHRTAHFAAIPNPVTTTTDVVITATLGGVSTTSTVTVSGPQAPLSSVSVAPATITGAFALATGEVALAIPTTDPVTVTLTSDDDQTRLFPSQVTVTAGHRHAHFIVNVGRSTSAHTVTITASADGVTRATTLMVAP